MIINLMIFFIVNVRLYSILEDDPIWIAAGHFLSEHVRLILEEIVVVVVYGFQFKVETIDWRVAVEVVDLATGAGKRWCVEKTSSNILIKHLIMKNGLLTYSFSIVSLSARLRRVELLITLQLGVRIRIPLRTWNLIET